MDFLLPLNSKDLANGGTNGQKMSEERMLTSGKNLVKYPLRHLFCSNRHSVEAAPLRDSCETARRHI